MCRHPTVHSPDLSRTGVLRYPIPLNKVVSVERFGFGRHLPTHNAALACYLMNLL
jgi:hypothetical protein